MSEHRLHRHRRRHGEPPKLDPRRSPFDQPIPEHHQPEHLERPAEHVSAAALQGTHELTQDLATYLHRIGVLAERRDTPADLRIKFLTQQVPRITDEVGNLPSRSIGVLNPSAIPVFVGLGGVPPTAAAQAPRVVANSFAVFPVSAEDLELGADPATLPAPPDGATVYLLRFASVQPAFYAAL